MIHDDGKLNEKLSILLPSLNEKQRRYHRARHEGRPGKSLALDLQKRLQHYDSSFRMDSVTPALAASENN